MLPRPLDTTIAHKAINLMPELSGTDKRIVGAIIDHFNRKTGRCDPSLERIAWLVGLSRRTVIRSVSNIVRTGILRKARHGGHAQCNGYQPVWPRFRELEAAWNARFKAKSWRTARSKMSPATRQISHLLGDEPVTQTLLTNPSNETLQNKPDFSMTDGSSETIDRKRHSGKQKPNASWVKRAASDAKTQSSIDAARSAAERRWNVALTDRFVGTAAHAQIIAAIDAAIFEAATDAEMRKPGAGLTFVLERVRLPASPNPSMGDASTAGANVIADD